MLVSEDMLDYAIDIVSMTHPDAEDAPETGAEVCPIWQWTSWFAKLNKNGEDEGPICWALSYFGWRS